MTDMASCSFLLSIFIRTPITLWELIGASWGPWCVGSVLNLGFVANSPYDLGKVITSV